VKEWMQQTLIYGTAKKRYACSGAARPSVDHTAQRAPPVVPEMIFSTLVIHPTSSLKFGESGSRNWRSPEHETMMAMKSAQSSGFWTAGKARQGKARVTQLHLLDGRAA